MRNFGETEDERNLIEGLHQYLVWMTGDVNNALSHAMDGDLDRVLTHGLTWIVNTTKCMTDLVKLVTLTELEEILLMVGQQDDIDGDTIALTVDIVQSWIELKQAWLEKEERESEQGYSQEGESSNG